MRSKLFGLLRRVRERVPRNSHCLTRRDEEWNSDLERRPRPTGLSFVRPSVRSIRRPLANCCYDLMTGEAASGEGRTSERARALWKRGVGVGAPEKSPRWSAVGRFVAFQTPAGPRTLARSLLPTRPVQVSMIIAPSYLSRAERRTGGLAEIAQVVVGCRLGCYGGRRTERV